MPVFRLAVERPASTRAISGSDAGSRLSLDKRFDLKPSFALLSPVFRFLHQTGFVKIHPWLFAPMPADNTPVLTPLRGPPAFDITLS